MNQIKAALLSALLSCAFAFNAASEAVVLHANTPQSSQDGHRFIVPSGWAIRREGAVAIVSAPESSNSRSEQIALVDVTEADADAALRSAWALYAPKQAFKIRRSSDMAVRQGWSAVRGYGLVTQDRERILSAVVRRHAAGSIVAISDMAIQIAEKRNAEIELLLGSLMPKGLVPERFFGVTAHRMQGQRLKAFDAFVEQARLMSGVPGAAVGIIQNGETVLAKGYGVRRLGKAEKVDADTRFMIASNTKPLTTLMLAKLIDSGKFTWDTPVRKVFPSFKLGDEATSNKVRMRHLVCACTGLPRQDMEWIFEAEKLHPASVISMVAGMQPTSAFGELYQYSNLLAGAAGYIGGQAQNPHMEIGAAYDAAMQSLVFDPLAMTATTFDTEKALRENYASPHDLDVEGRMAHVDMDKLSSNQLSRPDGGAWSTVNDLLRYLQMELNYGRLATGERYIDTAPLLARRMQQVSRGNQEGYGIGLKIDHSTGTTMLHHGGTSPGFISDVIWWPEHDVGAVILTNASVGGVTLRNVFRRRLMELMFDGNPEAETNLKVFTAASQAETAAMRAALVWPLPKKVASALAKRYESKELGQIEVRHRAGETWFDFGGWKSTMALRNPDDADMVLITSSPGVGFEFRRIDNPGQDSLILNDGNRDYEFRALE